MTDTTTTQPADDGAARANALIMGSSAPSVTFPEIGVQHRGIITALGVQQATKYETNEPITWKDGTPRMQAVITLQTDERDPRMRADRGVRRLFVSSKRMRDAIALAVAEAGAPELAIGGRLMVKYHDNTIGKNPANPPKVYRAIYEPPSADFAPDTPTPNGVDDDEDEPF